MKKIFLIAVGLICIASFCGAAYTTAVYFDQGGDRMVIASGGTLLIEDGATVTVDDGSLAPGDVAVANTQIIVGNASGVGAAVAMSGDATIANTGAVTIAADAVELSMLADDVLAGVVQTYRERVAVADINTGETLLAAISGYKYRLVNAKAIAIGGAAGTVTTVDILGTQAAGSVKLVALAQASLVQSAVLTAGGTGAAVLADGASFVACDDNTAITVGKTGGDLDTATHIDFIIDYVLEAE